MCITAAANRSHLTVAIAAWGGWTIGGHKVGYARGGGGARAEPEPGEVAVLELDLEAQVVVTSRMDFTAH